MPPAAASFTTYASLITALVAVAGVIVTIWKQISEARRERERRTEDRFAQLLTDLGADAAPTKAAAAAALVTYLAPEYARFHHQIRLAVLTNLKLPHEEPIRKLLARVYVAAMRDGDPPTAFERDLARAQLAQTDLSGIELAGADLAYADLRHAVARGVDLYRTRGIGVWLEGAHLGALDGRPTSLIEVRFRDARCRDADFDDALLVNAHLDRADLRGARFSRARLQAAHLRGARLEGATFTQANLAGAYFWRATFDEHALFTITRALNWRDAFFDDEVWPLLWQHARRRRG